MKEKLHFKFLPAYAEYLSINKVNDFTAEQLRLLKELKVPVLKFYENFSEEQLVQQGVIITAYFLKSLSENKVSEFMDTSTQKWLANQSPLLSRENLLPEDITLISFIRRKIFRDFLHFYTDDSSLGLKILEEVDMFTVEYDTLCFKNSMEIQAAELEQKNKKLEQTNKELLSFTYIASHDLQEPLRKIQAFSSRILQKEHDVLSDWGKEVFGKIQSAGNRMQKLIEALLNFSRLDKSHEPFVYTDINVLLEEAKNNLAEAIESRNATIEVGNMPVINVIPFHFQQLFSNLLSNALKYSKPNVDPHITVTSKIVEDSNIIAIPFSEGKKYNHICVSDNGIGFEQQYSEKIFELFNRLHGKSEYEGTGIGLAICKKIVDNHNGFISAKGTPGIGAEFNMYFPIEE